MRAVLSFIPEKLQISYGKECASFYLLRRHTTATASISTSAPFGIAAA